MKELIYFSDQQDLLPSQSQFRDTDLKKASIKPAEKVHNILYSTQK